MIVKERSICEGVWVGTIDTGERCDVISSITDIIEVNLMLRDLFLLFLRFVTIGAIVILVVGVVGVLLASGRCAIKVVRHYQFGAARHEIKWLFSGVT